MKYVAVIARRLREGKSYDDFIAAWYPDRGFGWTGTGPLVAQNVADAREILTYAQFELADEAELATKLDRVAAQEALRHDRIDAVIESTTVRGIYRVRDEFDFSTDETVAAGRSFLRCK
ncbi:MAG: hypothetical protein AAGH83_06725 [Pseudomonadota bacterium]